MLRRGHKLYYRHTVPDDAQFILNRLEIWRSLRTDSLAVAVRQLPIVVARIETEIEHVRAKPGLAVAERFFQPSKNVLVERSMLKTALPPISLRPRARSRMSIASISTTRQYFPCPSMSPQANMAS
ncbi:DUF6538 domain-containing protein [Sphingobium sp. TomTYG45]